MSLWVFLTWLWNGAAKVLDWFGDQYNNFRDKLANFWYYLGKQADYIYDTVSDWISAGIDNIRSEVLGWYNSLVAWLNSITEWVNNAVVDIKDWFNASINPIIDSVWNSITSWVSDLYSGLVEWINGIPGWVANELQGIRDWFTEVINPILPLGGLSDKLFILTEEGFFSKLIDLIQDGYKEHRLFITHPAGYILNIITDKALDFIGDVIGYGLGSVDTELPDKKDWSK